MPSSLPSRLRPALLPWTAALLAGLAVVVGLSWPLALHLRTWHLLTPFGDSHVWVFDWLARMLAAADLPTRTWDVGYPQTRLVRVIGWVPALGSLPLRPLLGPLGAANAIQLLSLPASGLVAAAWIRRRTGADPWTAAALGLAYGLGPTALSTFGIQEISNTQVWVIPLFLLALEAADRRLATLPLLLLASLAAPFTSPYLGLALPLVAGAWAAWRVVFPHPADGTPPGRSPAAGPDRPVPRARRLAGRLLRPALLLGVIALGMLPARLYYSPWEAAGDHGVFRPALRSEVQDHLPFPPPVARPDTLILGTDPHPRNPRESHHVAYLGAVLLAATALLALRHRPAGAGRRGAVEGLALLGGGILLALGPYLAWGDHLVRIGGARIPLPVWLLEASGYPTRIGGLYFRYAVLAEAGLVLLLGALLAGRRRAAPIAWAILALHVADGIRATGPSWPRPGERVQGLADLLEMRGTDGAVLELPLQGETSGALGQAGMLRAVFHGRPTSSLPRDVRAKAATLAVLLADTQEGGDVPSETLRRAGFRYVVLPVEEERGMNSQQAQLLRRLGTPWRDGDLRIWDLGPTLLAPLPLGVLFPPPPGGEDPTGP